MAVRWSQSLTLGEAWLLDSLELASSIGSRAADLGLAIALLSIPAAIFIAALRRRQVPCNWLACWGLASALSLGALFLLQAAIAPVPPAPLIAVKLLVAAIALIAALHALQRLPHLLALPSLTQLALVNQVLQREVSERRSAEAALKELNTDLEARVEQRTADLSAALTRLQTSEAELIDKNQALASTLQELQVAQAQLIHSEKMASLGQLVAGVAHEINNPIGFIYSNLGHLQAYTRDLLALLFAYQQESPSPSPALAARCQELDLEFIAADLPRLLDSLNNGAERIRDLVGSLRNFSRLDEAALKPANLQDGLEASLLLLQHRLHATPQRPAVQVETCYAPLPLVECYPSQLNQVFANLLSNALDALDRCSLWSPEVPPRLWIATRQEGQWIEVTIADNGPGLSETARRHLFDPFFTTKPVGQGRGLGLTIAYQIVADNHGGELQARSRPSGGAEFSVRLPLQGPSRQRSINPQAADMKALLK